MGGSVLQAPDVVVAAGEQSRQDLRQRQLAIFEALDRGENVSVPDSGNAQLDNQLRARLAGYRRATPDQRATFRRELEAEIAAFNPTPIQDRTLYSAGAAVQEFGRTLVPQLEGFDENSWSTQIGRGLGSMITGLGVSGLLGRTAGATFFVGGGMGEATDRAVQFDRTERAAGRQASRRSRSLPRVFWVLPLARLTFSLMRCCSAGCRCQCRPR